MINLNPLQQIKIDQRVEQFLCSLPSKEAVYISGPITTGKNYVNWYTTHGKLIESKAEYKKQHYNTVIAKNLDRILQFAEGVRNNGNAVIIEPASFDVAEWTQPDYLYYWGQIIVKCVGKIVFLDGWNYSNGCIYEYYAGLKIGVELVDQDFKPLNRVMAISLIENSIKECEDNGINVDFQKTVLSEIKNENKNE